MSLSYKGIITIEPGKCGGKPCIRGMRISVYDVLSYLASGMTIPEILHDFPYLTKQDVLASLSFAAERERQTLVAYMRLLFDQNLSPSLMSHFGWVKSPAFQAEALASVCAPVVNLEHERLSLGCTHTVCDPSTYRMDCEISTALPCRGYRSSGSGHHSRTLHAARCSNNEGTCVQGSYPSVSVHPSPAYH